MSLTLLEEIFGKLDDLTIIVRPILESEEDTTFREAVKQNIGDIKKIVREQAIRDNGKRSPSYAEVAKMAPYRSSLLVYDRNEGGTTESTMKKLKTVVNLFDLGVEIARVKNVAEGGLLIQTANKADLKRIEKVIKSNAKDTLRTKKSTKRMPQIEVQRVREHTDDGELVEAIWKQNEHVQASVATLEEFLQSIRVNHRRKLNDSETNVILDCTPRMWHTLTTQDRLNMGWSRHNVTNHINAKRCFKCQRYGHKATECKDAHDTCASCREHHRTADCKTSTVQCANCCRFNEHNAKKLSINHRASDNCCDSYIKARVRASEFIDFNIDSSTAKLPEWKKTQQ